MTKPPSNTAPFRADQFRLGEVALPSPPGRHAFLSLVPLPPAEATPLGEAFATIDPWLSYPYPASALARYFGDGNHTAPRLAIILDEEIAGVVGLRLDWLRGPYLQFLGVLPLYQGLGLGSRVLDWLNAETRSAGQRNIFVAASDFNAGALRFYERHGFKRVGTLAGLVVDDRDEILLHKKV